MYNHNHHFPFDKPYEYLMTLDPLKFKERAELPLCIRTGTVRPVREDALNRFSVRYWEGPVVLDGALGGSGYLELTGWGAEGDN